jgi:acetyl-CoA carboxylase carboxyl transferase subunit alpha
MELTALQRLERARNIERPHIEDFIGNIFLDFLEQRGDHMYGDDKSILCGIADLDGIPVTVAGHRKGHSLTECMEHNFGMASPEGFRKALRCMKQAEKFSRPIITFIDTPGAYPGKEAEEHGQGEAIARMLAEMSSFHVPVISIVTGEANSGGALAIGVSNRIIMLENAVYSVLSPEGFASILWHDSSRKAEACELMKMTAQDLYRIGVADMIIPEPEEGALVSNSSDIYSCLRDSIKGLLKEYAAMSPSKIREERRLKYRAIG